MKNIDHTATDKIIMQLIQPEVQNYVFYKKENQTW